MFVLETSSYVNQKIIYMPQQGLPSDWSEKSLCQLNKVQILIPTVARSLFIHDLFSMVYLSCIICELLITSSFIIEKKKNIYMIMIL